MLQDIFAWILLLSMWKEKATLLYCTFFLFFFFEIVNRRILFNFKIEENKKNAINSLKQNREINEDKCKTHYVNIKTK